MLLLCESTLAACCRSAAATTKAHVIALIKPLHARTDCRMAAQRDADFSELNAQIDDVLSKEDAYLAARVEGDWTAFNARLAAASAASHAALDKVNSSWNVRHAQLVADEAEFETEQEENNKMQQARFVVLSLQSMCRICPDIGTDEAVLLTY